MLPVQTIAIAGILLLVALSSALIVKALHLCTNRLATDEVLTIGLSGWLLPASLFAYIWFLFGFGFTLILILTLTIVLFLHPRFKTPPQPVAPKIAFTLLAFLTLALALRLIFVAHALLPSYFDAAAHYQTIQQVLTGNLTSPRYYHLGFHILAAFVTATLHIPIAQSMLILGQVILALLPVSLYPIVKHATQSGMAGSVAVLLAALGWYMPAHAADWSKYPALMSLGLIPIVLTLAYLPDPKRILSPRFLLQLAGGVVITTLTHSRAIIIFGIVLLAWAGSLAYQRASRLTQTILLIAALASLGWEYISIQKQTVLTLVFDPYLRAGMWVTLGVACLSGFAYKAYPHLTWGLLMTISLLLAALFVPVAFIPGYITLTLLDRPYVEMTLFLPLAMLGGLGVAGLEKTFRAQLGNWLRFMIGGAILAQALWTVNPYPSACCVLVSRDDLIALDWLDNQITTNARVAIASTQLNVLVSETEEGVVGSDAGIWITPLTGRVTIPLPNTTDFAQTDTHAHLCQSQIDYVYVGELGQMFNDPALQKHPEWYQAVLVMPRTRVYEVTGCK